MSPNRPESIEEYLRSNLQQSMNLEFGKRTIETCGLPDYLINSLNPEKPLRPYQRKTFQYFTTYWNADWNYKEQQPHLLFHMATGSGKTLIMAGLLLFLYEKGYRNFLFFVGIGNVVEKTRDNLLNRESSKYLFAQQITVGDRDVKIKHVDNFQNTDPDCINLCLTTIQALHSDLNTPKENSITYDDFANQEIVLISDEAHHMNASAKSGKNTSGSDNDTASDWETTVMRIFNSGIRHHKPNVLLEFTATEDFHHPAIADKYRNKVLFNYPLKEFRNDGYSKDILVVQSDLPDMERALQAVIMSQYKRKLFESIHQHIKPVIMFKSRSISENAKFLNAFVDKIKRLDENDIDRIRTTAKDDLAHAFLYFDTRGVTTANLLLELKEDFKEQNLLLVDGCNISPDKQRILNSLEDRNNEYRGIFAVDMLNEGWDVLNLFDIVRMQNTRDARSGVAGKTTNREAQLIGRGARYMPFSYAPAENAADYESDMIWKRKFDREDAQGLRPLETLHYHSSTNPRYVQELTSVLIDSGIIGDERTKVNESLKEDFKQTRLYREGMVYFNTRNPYSLNEQVTSIGDTIKSTEFKVHFHTGSQTTNRVFDTHASSVDTESCTYRLIHMRDLGANVVRDALNRSDRFRFDSLKKTFPNLKSISEFISSSDYLADIAINVYGQKAILYNPSQQQKHYIAIEALRQIEPMLGHGGTGYRGMDIFTGHRICEVFHDHELRFVYSDYGDKEFGRSMNESVNPDLRLNLEKINWYAQTDNFGTSEEKHLIQCIRSVYNRLIEKYDEIYLLRNEKDVRLYSFDNGDQYEPDFILFLHKKGYTPDQGNIQLFIESKGEHLRKEDMWKENALQAISQRALINGDNNITIAGMPFFTESKKDIFINALTEFLGID